MDFDVKASNLKTNSEVRVPEYFRLHPVIPRLYVPEWKTDMKNRKLITEPHVKMDIYTDFDEKYHKLAFQEENWIIKNATSGGIPNYEHDENLFLDKREQMVYNVENRGRTDVKYELPPRSRMLRPDFSHPNSKYQSGLMFRKDLP